MFDSYFLEIFGLWGSTESSELLLDPLQNIDTTGSFNTKKNTFLFIPHKYNHIVQNDWLVKYTKISIINKTTGENLYQHPITTILINKAKQNKRITHLLPPK